MTICPHLEVDGPASASRTSLDSSKMAIEEKLAVRIFPLTRSRSLDRLLPCTGSFYTFPYMLNCRPCCSNANLLFGKKRYPGWKERARRIENYVKKKIIMIDNVMYLFYARCFGFSACFTSVTLFKHFGIWWKHPFRLEIFSRL